ncbi:MAG: KilA-N domain-containing protein [Iphinoe sp. HA4291-MV1]|jgi:hypothetical protein|nr:KilA-N domain-containing protein [Iphinoe sp. HA4291-MV1]
MTDLILREFNGYQVRHREDNYLCLTDMASATGKRFYDWERLKSTKELISVLSYNNGISPNDLIQTKPHIQSTNM